jgi:putative phosphoesterase
VRIGLISDTHGKLRNEVFDHFAGVEQILHAGDIGDPDILTALDSIAPVSAVWGNSDGLDLRLLVKETVVTELAGRTILVVHGHRLGSPTPASLDQAHPDPDIVVFGHTHRPAFERIGRRLFLNPGSAGQARFGLKPSVAILTLEADTEDFRLITF